MDNSHKTDRRIIKSERAIRQAFWELLEEEGFATMTVKQIIDRADINRSTFYDHYQDKYDLMNKRVDYFLEQFTKINAKIPIEALVDKTAATSIFHEYLKEVLAFIQSNARYFTLLMREDASGFQRKLKAAISSIYEQRNLEEYLEIPVHYAVAAISGLMISLFNEWSDSGFRESAEELAALLTHFIPSIAGAVLDFNRIFLKQQQRGLDAQTSEVLS